VFGILDRYLGRAILATSLLVLLTLVALAAIFGFVSELEDVGKGNYTVLVAAQYVALTVPGMAYLLFSPAVLLGSLLGLGALAANSELTVMRAAGVSIARIIRSVLVTGLLLMMIVAVLGEVVMPRAERHAEQLRIAALDERLSLGGDAGLWMRNGPRYVNITTVMPDFTLLGVQVHEFGDGSLQRAIDASRAVLEDGEWWLEDVATSVLGEQGVTVTNEERVAWSRVVDSPGASLVKAAVLEGLSVSPDNLSILALAAQIDYLRDNALDSSAVRLAFWVKLTAPLATLVMLMLSLPFVFGSQRSGGAGQKIFVGIMLGIVYVLVNRLLTELGLANGLSPVLSAFAPLLLFATLAVIGIRRIA